jgi:arylsulfatase A-like enzyme
VNIVFVISDTLRRDHVGCYGNGWIRTPNLDRFAGQAVVFDQAYEASFPTMPTRADHFTGKLTLTYLGWAPLPNEEVVLAQLLREAGYVTMGIVDTPMHIREGMNYDRGFSDFIRIRGQGWWDVRHRERDDYNRTRRDEVDYCAPRTFFEAEKWLERNYKKRFFLLVDTWDPHEPWDPPHYYVEPYLPDYDGRVVNPVYAKYRGKVSAQDLKLAHACYSGEVTMVDFWFGRLMQRLESLDLLDKTAIIFTSDHGFYFGEHGYFGKGEVEKGTWGRSPLYDEITRVPLLISVPGMRRRRVPGLVCHPDLMPTVLGLAGAEAPKGIYGRSLLPLIRGGRRPVHEIVISSWPLYNAGEITRAVDSFERVVGKNLLSTIFDGEWTLLYSVQGEPVELYHTRRDPKQKRNLFRQNRKKAEELHAKFLAALEAEGTEERLLAPRRRL